MADINEAVAFNCRRASPHNAVPPARHTSPCNLTLLCHDTSLQAGYHLDHRSLVQEIQPSPGTVQVEVYFNLFPEPNIFSVR